MINERFWSKVKRIPNGCWEWQANKNNKGYGLFRPGGTAPKQLAHRVSYEMANGWIPRGQIIRHTCDNPICVNPDHLVVGTQKQNVGDAIERKRHVHPPDVRMNPEWEAKRRLAMRKGENSPNAKLNEQIVREIWRLHLEGYNATQISTKVQRSTYSIHDVCRGRTWRHLEGAPSIEELKRGGVRRGYNQFS